MMAITTNSSIRVNPRLRDEWHEVVRHMFQVSPLKVTERSIDTLSIRTSVLGVAGYLTTSLAGCGLSKIVRKFRCLGYPASREIVSPQSPFE